MTAIEKGNWIAVSYKGTLKDGQVFDTNEGKEPLVFEVGAGSVIKGFDEAVSGMNVGDSKTVTIPCAEAYGESSDERTEEVPKDFFQGVEKVEVGQQFMVQSAMGPLKVKVLTFDGEKATVSINHPLAGEDLTFEIKVEKTLTTEEAQEHQEKMAKMQAEMMKKMQEEHGHSHEDGCCGGACGSDNEEGTCCKDDPEKESCDCGHKH